LKLVVVCPGGAVTGGPEALHQLVYMANQIEAGSAAIMYVPNVPTPSAYLKYGCPTVTSVSADQLVVLPEIWPEMARQFPDSRCALWWLSVDNFGSHGQVDLSGISLHLCQSEYAMRHVSWKVSAPKMMLTDWVDLRWLDVPRYARVVVNPAKDAGLMRPFMARHSEVEFVELAGLDRVGVARLLWGSQMYIDFGRHPGRDRPPREAALAGCVVLSVELGSARLSDDMPLDDCYKFSSLDECSAALEMVMSDWRTHHEAQAGYRSVVANQRDVFRREVGLLLDFCLGDWCCPS